ncbi:hypothetical protein GTO10_02315 [Candidatus Saccharibacteria bacterium]|nr:hypothetical protein [Candidatus Saccharibacteria bacterium]
MALAIALAFLTAVLWVGWFLFEKESVLERVDFSAKTVQTVDPHLDVGVLGN